MTKKITDIYGEYQIPYWLGEHMLRVAAIAVLIFDAAQAKNPSLSGRQDLITANLLHDMGNVIKFDLERRPLPDGRLEYWKDVQAKMIEKYGKDEFAAVSARLAEMGLRETVDPILHHASYPYSIELAESGSFLQMISYYADQRVALGGVVSLEDRLHDMHLRYAHTGDIYKKETEQARALDAATFAIEKKIFTGLDIAPGDITGESVQRYMDALRDFDVLAL